MCDYTAAATLSALQITTTVKVSQKGSSEIFILHDKSLFLQKKNQSIKKNHTSAIKKSHICGSIWGLYLDIFYYLFVYQLVTVLQLISTGLLDMYWQLGNGLYKYQNLFNAIANGDISQIREESKVQYKTPAGKWNFDKGRYENRLNEYFHYKFGGIITKRRFQ